MKILRHIIVPAGFFCLAASLSTMPVMAQERVGDGALGALAGAVVLGPIGLLAGGVIGYTAGPGIADSWGTRYHRHYYRRAHYHRRRY